MLFPAILAVTHKKSVKNNPTKDPADIVDLKNSNEDTRCYPEFIQVGFVVKQLFLCHPNTDSEHIFIQVDFSEANCVKFVL